MPNVETALLTDLYQLMMLQCYFRSGLTQEAVFEVSVRNLPKGRNFLIAAGLEQVVDWLAAWRFTPAELAWLDQCGHFAPDFVEHLAGLRYDGDVHALPEGTICFANEPLLRVTASLPIAQFVESRILNLLQLQTMLTSKAVRCVLAAPGKLLVDFGFRRSHGAEAGLLAARATYLAGFAGTATVAAGRAFGIPLYGTMAHSLIEAFGNDRDAFTAFARACPNNVVLLLDTFDTIAGARAAVEVASRLAAEGIQVRSVRLDSGDLAALARAVRKILDDGGLDQTTIFASGGLDEHALAKLVADGAPIDGFGVGTAIDVSADAPYLEIVYKLVEYDGQPRRKHSPGKLSLPGCKQVFRRFDNAGRMAGDIVAVETDSQPGTPLLVQVLQRGERMHPPETLDAIRARVTRELVSLPEPLRSLQPAAPYPVSIAPSLIALAQVADQLTT